MAPVPDPYKLGGGPCSAEHYKATQQDTKKLEKINKDLKLFVTSNNNEF